MRKIHFTSTKIVDVLIVDEMGSNFVKYCIPNSASSSILPIRGKIPIILSFRFLYSLTKRLLNTGKPKESLIFSIVDSLNPKVIITFIDNSPLMGIIYKEFPDKTCMSIQNGFRTGFAYPTGSFRKLSMHTLFGFGKYEKKMLDNEKVYIKEYVPVGSLRYGIHKKYFSSAIKQKYNICFISDYSGVPKDNALKELKNNSSKLFTCLVNICQKYNYTICVALRSDKDSKGYINEINYYNNLDSHSIASMVPNKMSELRSYSTVLSADVAVTTISTMGFEVLGSGKKVLFGAGADNFRLAKSWDSYNMFQKLENFNLLNEISVDAVYKKLKFLLQMDIENYVRFTEKSRIYYMNNINSIPAHELIQDNIDKYLINKS
jgi:surface carbohydrate biosynthesis protein